MPLPQKFYPKAYVTWELIPINRNKAILGESKAPIGAIDLYHMQLFHYTQKKSFYGHIEINVINSYIQKFWSQLY